MLCHKKTYLFLSGVSCINDTCYLTRGDNEDPVAKLNKNVKVLADKYDCNAVFFLLVEKIVYTVRCIDVKSSYRVSRHKYRRSSRYLTTNKYLLYVTARKSADGSILVGCAYVQLVDKLRDTSESHSRCTVVEVMGRDAGDIALQTSIALGAVTAVIKEIPTDFDHVIEKMVEARKGGKRNFIIITSEGMGKDYGEDLSRMIESRSGIETRFARLAHIQRGGSPTLRDRVLATQMGCAAVENLVDGQMKQVMCLRGNNIVAMDIFDALTVDKLMKGKLTPEEEEAIPPNKLYEMKRIVADKQAYKKYLNYIIDHITL